MKVALVQMTAVPDIEENIKSISINIKKAVKSNAKIVLFPENCSFMGPGKVMFKNAYYENVHPTLRMARELANKYNIFILLGSISVLKKIKASLKMVNRSYFIDDKGRVLDKYDKINMFDAVISKTEIYKESNRYHAGKRIVVVKSKIGNFGLSICYDIRFPELYQKLAKLGSNIITIPSAFTEKTGKDHWQVLLRSRAIETSCWVLAPAQIGKHYDGRKTWGHSMIVDPWGRVVTEANKSEKIIYGDINLGLSNKTKFLWGR